MAASEPTQTANPKEIAWFEAQAEAWWDSTGAFRPLHQINPPRLAFLRRTLLAHFGRDEAAVTPFSGLSLLDIGCGGGLFSEPLARLGFSVTAIDAGEKNIEAARRHAETVGLAIDYRAAKPENIDGQFDVVTTMEVLEHVPSVERFMDVASARLKPGGAFLAATLNRTPQSYALAIVGAERVLRWLPKGTHHWAKFIRPSELAARMRRVGIVPAEFSGVRFDPLRARWIETSSLDVNYLVYGVKKPV